MISHGIYESGEGAEVVMEEQGGGREGEAEFVREGGLCD